MSDHEMWLGVGGMTEAENLEIMLYCSCGREAYLGFEPDLQDVLDNVYDHLDGAKVSAEPYVYKVTVGRVPIITFEWRSRHVADVAQVALQVRKELNLGDEAAIKVVQA